MMPVTNYLTRILKKLYYKFEYKGVSYCLYEEIYLQNEEYSVEYVGSNGTSIAMTYIKNNEECQKVLQVSVEENKYDQKTVRLIFTYHKAQLEQKYGRMDWLWLKVKERICHIEDLEQKNVYFFFVGI